MQRRPGKGLGARELLKLFRPRRIGGGFTLIELLVVVVIISFLGAVAAPALLSRLSQDPEGEAPPAEPLRQAPPSAVALPDPTGRQVLQPVFVSTEVRLDVLASHALEGFRVFTRYDAAYSGTFVVRNVDPVVDSLTLTFPFPPDVNEVRDVSLRLRDAAGEPVGAPGVRYGLEGIEWTGQVPPDQTITAVVSYTARGRDGITYDVVGSGRSGAVSVEVRLRNAPRVVVPADALQPAEEDGGTLSWRFESLITNKPIVLELPAGTSPLGRVILVLQLAGVAVLLFGGGFWYLSEGQTPGRLEHFRWGHFLLLALNYSLFFAVYAVLGYRGSSALALTAAALVSLPLLTLHVARITDLRFALGRVLPLAVFTSATVVTGVFLDRHRPLVLLVAAVVFMAFLTLTYGSWLAGRTRFAEAEGKRREAAARKAELAACVEELSALLRRQQELRERVRREMEETPPGFDVERAEAERLLDLHESAFSQARAASEEQEGRDEGLAAGPQEADVRETETALARVRRSSELLQGRGESLEAAVHTLGAEAQQARQRLRHAKAALAVALGEASSTEAEAASVLEEARGLPGQAELHRALERCQEAQRAARRVSDAPSQGDIRGAVRAMELRTASLRTFVTQLREAVDKARGAVQRAGEATYQEGDGDTGTHCLKCGERLLPGHRFCALCGTPRPLALNCTGCGRPTRLPKHLLAKGWKKRTLHCPSCGEALPSPHIAEKAGSP